MQKLQKELDITRKKLQKYADTIVSLHDELRTLRESICNSCKRQFVPASLVDSKSEIGMRKYFIDSTSQTPKSSPVPLPSRIHPTSHSNVEPAPTTVSSKNIPQQNTEHDSPRWYVIKRDAMADSTLDVTFGRTFMHSDPVHYVRFSTDGRYLAAALKDRERHNNGTIVVYDVETGKQTCTLKVYASKYPARGRPGILCVCFSPDDRYLIFGDTAGQVAVWDIQNKRMRNIFRGHDGSVRSVDCSSTGTHAIASASLDETVRVWNTRDGSAKVFSDNSHGFWCVKFSPDGRCVAAGNSDWSLRMWDVRTCQMVMKWTGHRGTIWSVAYMPDGKRLVSGSGDGAVKSWDLSSFRSGGELFATDLLEREGHINSVYAVAVSPDARWIASSLSNERSVIWDASTALPECTLIGHRDAVSAVDFSPAGSYMSLGSHDGRVSLWRYSGS